MKWYHRLFRPLFNWVGALNGNSGCLICGDSWYWKEPYIVHYSKFEGAFPVCEECWQTEKTEDIVRAARELGDKWIAQSCPEQRPKCRRVVLRMVATVEKAAKRRCDFCPIGPQRKGILPASCVGCKLEEIKKEAYKERIKKRAEQSKGLRQKGGSP